MVLWLGMFASPVSVKARVVFGAGVVEGVPPLQEAEFNQESVVAPNPLVLATVKVFEASAGARKSSLPLPPSPVQPTCVPAA